LILCNDKLRRGEIKQSRVGVVGRRIDATNTALRIGGVTIALNGRSPGVAAGGIAAGMGSVASAGALVVGLAGDAGLVAIDDCGDDCETHQHGAWGGRQRGDKLPVDVRLAGWAGTVGQGN